MKNIFSSLLIVTLITTSYPTQTANMSLPNPATQQELGLSVPVQQVAQAQTQSLPPSRPACYFDTKFLANYDKVKQSLQEDGFQDIWFKSEDGVKINGLLLTRPNATYTVISCSGFFPGRMEGMATLYPLLPEDCNILFFNARGHGNSEGYFKAKILMYGNNEYKDVIGAINYAHDTLNGKPILIHGVCIGSYHASHALLDLQKNNLFNKYLVKGFIFDSGFGSATKISNALKYDLDRKILPGYFVGSLPDGTPEEEVRKRYQEVRKQYLFRITRFLALGLFRLMQLCYTPVIWYREPAANLFDKIEQLPCPIFYIHAENDTYTSIEQAKKLAAHSQSPTCWWVPNSTHACIQLKQKEEYHQKLAAFIAATMTTTSKA